MVLSVLRNLFARRVRSLRPHPLRRPRSLRVALEHLEDRLTPAQVNWICDTGDWNTPSCWNVNRLPDAMDDVEIDRPGNITVTNSLANTSILSLRNADTLELLGQAATPALFRIGAASQNVAGATLRVSRATINGPGTLTNLGTVESTGISRLDAGFSNETTGTLRHSAANRFGGANNLTIATGFTNNGRIEITSSGGAFTSTLIVASGTLTNALTGTITSVPGSGGSRNLSGTVINLGQIVVNQNLALDTANRTFTNDSGIIDVADGRLFSIKAGTMGLGTTVFGSGTQLRGTGTVDLGGTMNLQLPSDFTLAAGGPTLTFEGDVAVTGAGRFINQSTFQMTSDVFVVAVLNQGTFEALATSNLIQGTFTSDPDSILRVVASRSDGDAALTVAQGFTNNGTVELTARQSDAGSTLNILAGTLFNPDTRMVVIGAAGAAGGRVLGGSFTNEGTLRLVNDLFVENAGRTFTNSLGQINFVPSVNLTIQDGNSVFGDGLLLMGLNNNRLNLAGTHTMSLSGQSFVIRSDGPQLKLVGRVTINGPGRLIASSPLELTGDIINAPLDNQSEIIALGDGNQINGQYTATPGSGIRIEGRNPGCGLDPGDPFFRLDDCGDASLTIGRDFTNSGPFRLTSVDDVYFALLAMPANATLTNDATISVLNGSGGDRFIFAQFLNRGTIAIESVGLIVAGAGANHVNDVNGVIDATIGSIQINNAATFRNLGTLDVGDSQFAILTDGSLSSYDAGARRLIEGTYRINQGEFRFPGADIVINRGNIQLTGNNAFICDQMVALCDATSNALLNFAINERVNPNVFGTFQISNRTFDVAANFTNDGQLIVGPGSNFNVVNGDLTNFSAGTLRGQGVYDIRGTLRFRGANILNNGDSTVANSPTIALRSGAAAIRDEVDADALATFQRNNGTVIVEGGRDLILDSFINAGVVQINANGTVTVGIDYDQISGGTLRMRGGLLQANSGVTVRNRDGGLIDGDGVIQSTDVRNEGRLAPGISDNIGVITIKGNYTQTGTGSLEITMTGNGQNDRVVIEEIVMGDGLGQATLAGGVVMQPVNPYNPAAGHSFDVLAFVMRSGTFGSVTGVGGPYTADYSNPNRVTIRR